MKTGAITVERMAHLNSDAGVCDAARVSMEKKASEFSDGDNEKLIKYLAKHKHWSPFGHSRICLTVESANGKDIRENLFDFFMEANLAGFSWKYDKWIQALHISGSVWAWYENWKYLLTSMKLAVYQKTLESFPIISKALFQELMKGRFDSMHNVKAYQTENHIFDKFEKLDFVSLRVTAPIFVARQLVKHQVELCWNEESRRYIDSPVTMYETTQFRARPDGSIKQGSGEVIPEPMNGGLLAALNDHHDRCLSMYESLLLAGVAPEQARIVLPLDMQVQWIWTGNLAAWRRVYGLRSDAHAQLETREFAARLLEAVPEAGEDQGATQLRGRHEAGNV